MNCYRFRDQDPETLEWGPEQYHVAYDNGVVGTMDEESAKTFARFVLHNKTFEDGCEHERDQILHWLSNLNLRPLGLPLESSLRLIEIITSAIRNGRHME